MNVLKVIRAALAGLLAGLVIETVIGCTASTSRDDLPTQYRALIGNLDTISQGANAATLRWPTQPEIWVIEKPQEATTKPPYSGSPLRVVTPAGDLVRTLAPRRTDVKVGIDGFIARTDLSQRFETPSDDQGDAEYEFRLPSDASVSDFVVTIGDRQIRAVVRDRVDAERIYRQAIQQGYMAALVSENASGTVRENIGHLIPGKPIDVTLRYFNTLEYRAGWFEYDCPLAGLTGGNGNSAPGDIAMDIHVNAGLAIEDIQSPTHEIDVTAVPPDNAEIRLVSDAHISSRDFALRFHLAGTHAQGALLTQGSGDARYFTLMLAPPILADAQQRPVDLHFVLAGMQPEPNKIATATEIMDDVIKSLRAGDSYEVIGPLGIAEPLDKIGAATPLQQPATGDVTHAVIVIGDDLIGMADQHPFTDRTLLSDARAWGKLGRTLMLRLASPSESTLYELLARASNGVTAAAPSPEDGNRIANQFITQCRASDVSNLSIDWSTAKVSGVALDPIRSADGRLVILIGQYTGEMPSDIRISASIAGKPRVWTARSRTIEPPPGGTGSIEYAWARVKITALADQYMEAPDTALLDQIKQMAMNHSMVSPLTSLLMVDALGSDKWRPQ